MRKILEIIMCLALAVGGGCRVFANAVVPGTVQTHPGIINRELDGNVNARHLIVNHDMTLAGANDLALGVVDDVGTIGDYVAVSLLGGAPTTLVMIASEAISPGDRVALAAGGKVRALPETPGTYQEVGVAITETALDGDEIEVVHCLPRTVVVE